MKMINSAALAVISALALSGCGQSIDSLCAEHARASMRFSELVVKGANDPTKHDAAEFQKATDALVEAKGKLESKGSSSKACP